MEEERNTIVDLLNREDLIASEKYSAVQTVWDLNSARFDKTKVPSHLKSTFRSRFKTFLKQHGYLLDIEVLHVVISVLFVAVFIADTYLNFDMYTTAAIPLSLHMRLLILALYVCDLVLSVITVAMWSVSLLATKHKLRFLMHPISLLDFVTVIPMVPFSIFILVVIQVYGMYDSLLILSSESHVTLRAAYYISILISIGRIFRLLRILFVLTWKKNILHYVLETSFGFGPTIQVQVVALAIMLITMILFFSGAFQMIEFMFGGNIMSLSKFELGILILVEKMTPFTLLL